MDGCLARTCQSSNGCAEHMFAKGLLEDLAEPMRQGSLGENSRWKCGDEHRWTGPASFPQMAEHLDPTGFVQSLIPHKAAGIARGLTGTPHGPGCVSTATQPP